jgi:hypothetical protein
MAAWTVICSACNSNIVHSQAGDENLSEFFLPLKPDVAERTAIICPRGQATVVFRRTDLRYAAWTIPSQDRSTSNRPPNKRTLPQDDRRLNH